MKYDIDIDSVDSNTSHGIILEMIGTGKRVLDVGCATGYLARLLSERGNQVVGIEIDAVAASQAEPWLERIVIGDLEKLDLDSELEADRFDAIVLADVLEHLSDPLAVLRQTPSLLRPGGSVIVSIPNVAHGAVRLALLGGHFDYQPLGLLDDTHLRFFTRSTVDDLLRAAGLVPAERRRTTADVFATEIPVDEDRLASGLVGEVLKDPDATTYQFVVRSLPVDESESTRALVAELLAKDAQINNLRGYVDAIVRGAADPVHGPAIGLVIESPETSGGPLAWLRTSVIAGELRGRLGGFAVRYFDSEATEPTTSWTGEPVCPLQPWGVDRAGEIAAVIDALVFSGPTHPDAIRVAGSAGCATAEVGTRPVEGRASGSADEPMTLPDRPGDVIGPRLLLGAPSGDGGTESGTRAIPDPLLLVSRVAGPDAMERRFDYLRALGRLPADGPCAVIALWEVPETSAAAVARSLDEVAARTGSRLVVLAGARSAQQPGFTELLTADQCPLAIEDPVDLVAVIAGSELVVTDSAAMLATAIGLRRPCQALAARPSGALIELAEWLGDPDVILDRPTALPGSVDLARARARDDRTYLRLTDLLDGALDEVAAGIRGTLGRRAALSIPVRLAELNERLSLLTLANQQLQDRMAKERLAFGNAARELRSGGFPAPADELDQRALDVELRIVRARLDEAEREIQAIYATKTMRALQPARQIYRRLRLPQ